MDMTSHSTPSASSDLQTGGHNVSVPGGCIAFRFSDLVLVDPHNIVSEEAEMYSRRFRLIMITVLFVLGVPANIINMAVFYKQGLKDRVNLLLFFISLADVMFFIVTFIMHVEEFYMPSYRILNPGPVFKAMLKYNLIAFSNISFVSFVLSAIIACERCYCVLRPLKYQTVIRTRTMAVIIIAVNVVVLGLSFASTFRYGVVCIYNIDTGTASEALGHQKFYIRHRDFIDNIDNIFFGAGLPVLVTVVMVIVTAITTSTLRKTMAWRAEATSSLSPKEVALTKMLVATSVLLIVCIFPNCIFRVACLFLPELNTGKKQHNLYVMCISFIQVFVSINASFNIFIYYVMGTRYRQTFWALFRRKNLHTEK